MYKFIVSLLVISFLAAGCDTTSDQPTLRSNLEGQAQSSPVTDSVPKTIPSFPTPKGETSQRKSAGSSCNSNYSGCVPIASDVDCAGGSGNGPAYVSGPVTVTGSDIYDLDRDGDGIACE